MLRYAEVFYKPFSIQLLLHNSHFSGFLRLQVRMDLLFMLHGLGFLFQFLDLLLRIYQYSICVYQASDIGCFSFIIYVSCCCSF